MNERQQHSRTFDKFWCEIFKKSIKSRTTIDDDNTKWQYVYICFTILRRRSKFFVCAFSSFKHFSFVIIFFRKLFYLHNTYICVRCDCEEIARYGLCVSMVSFLLPLLLLFLQLLTLQYFSLLLWIRLMRTFAMPSSYRCLSQLVVRGTTIRPPLNSACACNS